MARHEEALPDRLRKRRLELKLSIKVVCTQAGVSRSYYYDLENRLGKRPSAAVLERLARVLETSTAYLLGQTGRIERGLPLAGMPPELVSAAHRLALGTDDVRMLATVNWRGSQPRTEDAWLFLAQSIRYACS